MMNVFKFLTFRSREVNEKLTVIIWDITQVQNEKKNKRREREETKREYLTYLNLLVSYNGSSISGCSYSYNVGEFQHQIKNSVSNRLENDISAAKRWNWAAIFWHQLPNHLLKFSLGDHLELCRESKITSVFYFNLVICILQIFHQIWYIQDPSVNSDQYFERFRTELRYFYSTNYRLNFFDLRSNSCLGIATQRLLLSVLFITFSAVLRLSIRTHEKLLFENLAKCFCHTRNFL